MTRTAVATDPPERRAFYRAAASAMRAALSLSSRRPGDHGNAEGCLWCAGCPDPGEPCICSRDCWDKRCRVRGAP